MNFKRNIIASYASQIYVTAVTIVMVPLYIQYMGAEAYGLVGFFAMLQAWFNLLDMGLTPTISRECSRFNGGASDALSLRRLLRALEGIFIGIAVLGGAVMAAGSGVIASSWLKLEQLPLDQVQYVIMLMAVIIALRWVCGLYRGAINGFERLVWLSGFNAAVASARFVLIVPIFVYVGTSPIEFFGYQLIVAVIELIVLVTKTYSLMPKIHRAQRTSFELAPLRGVLKFSLSIAFTGSVWVLVTQTDKLVLSKLLPLAEYAYFTLAVLVAGGVSVVSGPISAALLPRMTRMSAESDKAVLISFYRNATQLVGVIAIPAALVLTFFAEQVLWAWTGDTEIARKTAPILKLYALGNGVLAMGAFPFYLQYAKGDLKMHLIGNFLFVLLFIPTLVFATIEFGVIGAGWTWLSLNVVYFLVWVPKVHRRFVKGLHTSWLLRDVGYIAFATTLTAYVLVSIVPQSSNRLNQIFIIILVGVSVFLVGAIASSFCMDQFKNVLRTRIFMK